MSSRPRATETYDTSEGHRRWSQGMLFDRLSFENPNTNREALALFNRGHYGTGHGWSAAHAVAWNVDSGGRRIIIHKPPTAQNYGIGNRENTTGDGPFDHSASHIEGTGQTPNPPFFIVPNWRNVWLTEPRRTLRRG